MVVPPLSVGSLGDVAAEPQQNRDCQVVQKHGSRVLQPCCTRDLLQNVSLIHPTEIPFGGNWRTENDDLCNAFCNAALSELPMGTTIDQISFENISLGLLMVLFTDYGKTRSTRDAGAAIIKQSACFRGSLYAPDNEGGRKLHGYYSCKQWG